MTTTRAGLLVGSLSLSLSLWLVGCSCSDEPNAQGGGGGGAARDRCASFEPAGDAVSLPYGVEPAHTQHQMALGQGAEVVLAARLLREKNQWLGVASIEPWGPWPLTVAPFRAVTTVAIADQGSFLLAKGPGAPKIVVPDEAGTMSLYDVTNDAIEGELLSSPASPTFAVQSGGTLLARFELPDGADPRFITESYVASGAAKEEDASPCKGSPFDDAVALSDGFLAMSHRAISPCAGISDEGLELHRYRLSDGPGSSLVRAVGASLPGADRTGRLTPRSDGAWFVYRGLDGVVATALAQRVDRDGVLLPGDPIAVMSGIPSSAFLPSVAPLGDGVVVGWRDPMGGEVHVRLVKSDGELAPEIVLNTPGPWTSAYRVELVGAPDGSSVLVMFDTQTPDGYDEVNGASLLRLDCVPEAP